MCQKLGHKHFNQKMRKSICDKAQETMDPDNTKMMYG